jgi:hypothetical protein
MTNEPQLFLHDRLADSKKLVRHGHVEIAEAWTRTLLCDASSPDALIKKLSLYPIEALQARCPDAARTQCWSNGAQRFSATQAQLEQANKDLQRLRDLGVDVVWVPCAIRCVEHLNQSRREGIGRMGVDLQLMETLLVSAREAASTKILACCGKVGSLTRYESRFTLLSAHPMTTVREQASESVYLFAGLGEVRFLRDAEERDPLVSLASLVGKYVRETLMGRIVEHYQREDPRIASLPSASGYHDPNTYEFVRAAKECRDRLGIPDVCFLREERLHDGQSS